MFTVIIIALFLVLDLVGILIIRSVVHSPPNSVIIDHPSSSIIRVRLNFDDFLGNFQCDRYCTERCNKYA